MSQAVCLICGSQDHEVWVKDYEPLRLVDHPYSILQCHECHFKFVYPKPSLEDQKNFYGPGFYISPNSRGRMFRILECVKNIFCGLRLQMIARWIKKPGIVLDIGCGNGDFLDAMQRRGWQVSGVDSSKESCRLAREKVGESVFCGNLSECNFKDGSYDMITLWHVPEHVADLDLLLKKIYALLHEKGILVIAIPNAQGVAEVLKSRWVFLDLPRHLYHFQAKHLQKILQRNNFQVKKQIFFSWEYSPMALLLNFLNLITTQKLYLYYLLKRRNLGNLKLSVPEHVYNFLISIAGVVILWFPAVLLSVVLAVFRSGDNLTVIAGKRT